MISSVLCKDKGKRTPHPHSAELILPQQRSTGVIQMQTKWTLLVFTCPHWPVDGGFYSILVVRSVFKVTINL